MAHQVKAQRHWHTTLAWWLQCCASGPTPGKATEGDPRTRILAAPRGTQMEASAAAQRWAFWEMHQGLEELSATALLPSLLVFQVSFFFFLRIACDLRGHPGPLRHRESEVACPGRALPRAQWHSGSRGAC